jgi:hypothetical protein
MTYKEQVIKWADDKKLIVWLVIGFALVTAALSLSKSIEDLLTPKDRADKRVAAKSLILDLQRVGNLLPIQQSYSDCIAKRKDSSLNVLSACLRERKASMDDPLKIINQNIVISRLSFSEPYLSKIVANLESMSHTVYEMQNNQTVLEYWLRESCSRGIKVSTELPKATKTDVRCTLAVQDYGQFLARSAKNSDIVSPMVKSTGLVQDFKLFITEGLQDDIDSYFARSNNILKRNFLEQEQDLIATLEALAK